MEYQVKVCFFFFSWLDSTINKPSHLLKKRVLVDKRIQTANPVILPLGLSHVHGAISTLTKGVCTM